MAEGWRVGMRCRGCIFEHAMTLMVPFTLEPLAPFRKESFASSTHRA